MDVFMKNKLNENSLAYKRSLDRIIDKYSKLQYQDAGIEVDLNCTRPKILERYMEVSKHQLNKLESKSLTDLREESFRVQDVTRDSLLDFTHRDGVADETCLSTSQFSCDDDRMSQSDTTELTVSSLDESERNLSGTELQPEDRDEELELTLRSHGGSLETLYPSMISRIERAWHRQNVSTAADSVLRRYRRWRQLSNRSNLGNTFVVTLKHAADPRKMTSAMLLQGSPERSRFARSGSAPRSPLQALRGWQPSPEKERGSLRREQPILAMDLSGQLETFVPKEEVPLNQTFTVSNLWQPGQQPCAYVGSHAQPCHPSPKASLDSSLRSRRLSLSAHSEQALGCSAYALEVTAAKERSDFYSSSLGESPMKARVLNGLSRSPRAFSRSPKDCSGESFSTEATRPRSRSTSQSSPFRNPAAPARMLYLHDSHTSLQPQLQSPQPAAAGPLRLRRHLSFDSSLPSNRASYSPKKIDEDFTKLYHKFVCQNQSFYNGPPCRLCARSPDAGRGRSSSALAALALSPHRSVLRKRHRELDWDSRPRSKRSRDECCASSPGSRRHGGEMLRRRLAPSEFSHGDLSYSSGKHSLLNRLCTQQRSADAHQDTWMGRSRSAAESSGLGGSFESSMTNGHSPRKWW